MGIGRRGFEELIFSSRFDFIVSSDFQQGGGLNGYRLTAENRTSFSAGQNVVSLSHKFWYRDPRGEEIGEEFG
jgi:hypothetical protein